MTECQGCGAWNERRRTLCVLCGTPLAETDEWDAAAELPPLPPLPDGGLSVTMPAWLRALPATPQPPELASQVMLATDEAITAAISAEAGPAADAEEVAAVAAAPAPLPEDAAPPEPPLGPHADPRTFLRDDDFPRWIRELPTLPPRPVPPIAVVAPAVAEPAALVAPVADPAPPPGPRPDPDPAASDPSLQDRHVAMEAGDPLSTDTSDAETDAAANAAPHRREAWETPLLVVLVVGVAVAVIWALLVNGIIGGGL